MVFIDGMVDCRSLAKTAGINTSLKSAYIGFFTKMQKEQSQKMNFAFLISKNTTLRFLAE
jgi:hypothetical protein